MSEDKEAYNTGTAGNSCKGIMTTNSKVGALNFDDPFFFDLETSGLDFRKHQIIQIAAKHPRTGALFERKLRFRLKSAEPAALETVGFTKKAWKDAVPRDEALRDFSKWVNHFATSERLSKRGNVYKVAVAMGFRIDRFDVPFLTHEMLKKGLWVPFDFRVYDVFQLALWVLPGLDDYSLSAIARHLGVEMEGAHDALVDVEMTAAVVRLLLREIYDPDQLPVWTRE